MKPENSNPIHGNAVSSLAAGAIAAVIYTVIYSFLAGALQGDIAANGIRLGVIVALFVFAAIQVVRRLWVKRG
ncbi:MAG: hypothetical protein HXY42_08140 [Chloroflexi bacterium]|nr:hypothetical protein [Chloroflexota bacterium]